MRGSLHRRLWWRRTGWLAMVGFALAVAGLVGHLYWMPAQHRRLEKQQDDYRRLVKQLTAPPAKIVSTRIDPRVLLAQRHAAFHATLATQAKAPALVKAIFAQAQKAGLTLAQAEYRMVPEKSGGYVGYQMIIPVRGPYLKIRQFIDAVLVEIPSGALEEVSFKREGVGTTVTEARLRFVIFLRNADV